MALMIQYWLIPIDHDLIADFSLRNFRVFTIDYKQYLTEWVDDEHNNDNYPNNQVFLIIKAWTTIEEFDSLMEGVLTLRPELLSVLGLLTFVTGEISLCSRLMVPGLT